MRVCILCSVRFWFWYSRCTVRWRYAAEVCPRRGATRRIEYVRHYWRWGGRGGKEDKIEEPSTTSTIQCLFFVAHLAKLPFTTLCTVDGEWISSSGRMVRGIHPKLAVKPGTLFFCPPQIPRGLPSSIPGAIGQKPATTRLSGATTWRFC